MGGSFLPNWVGIFDDPLMPKRGRGGKGWGRRGGGVKDTYRNSKDVRSLKVPSSISNK